MTVGAEEGEVGEGGAGALLAAAEWNEVVDFTEVRSRATVALDGVKAAGLAASASLATFAVR
jgi:hypothetical protein